MSDERQASEHADELVYTLDAYAREREVSPETRSYQEWSAAFEAVRDYIAAIEADRARLDWMAENPYAIQPDTAVDPSWNTDGFHDEQDGWAAVDKCLWFADLRAAIDAAMSSSPLAPTQEGA